MARVDVLPHVLLNVRWNDNLLRFTVGHAIVRPGRNQQHGVRHRCDGNVRECVVYAAAFAAEDRTRNKHEGSQHGQYELRGNMMGRRHSQFKK